MKGVRDAFICPHAQAVQCSGQHAQVVRRQNSSPGPGRSFLSLQSYHAEHSSCLYTTNKRSQMPPPPPPHAGQTTTDYPAAMAGCQAHSCRPLQPPDGLCTYLQSEGRDPSQPSLLMKGQVHLAGLQQRANKWLQGLQAVPREDCGVRALMQQLNPRLPCRVQSPLQA